MNLLDKIRGLLSRFNNGFEEDKKTIEYWYEEAQQLLVLDGIKQLGGIKYLIDILTTEVKEINRKLANNYSQELPDKQRDRLLDKRDMYLKFLNLFEVEERIKDLEDRVDSELKRLD